MPTIVSTQDLPNLWALKFISELSKHRFANRYIEAWAADIVNVASSVIQLNKDDIKITLKNNHPEPQDGMDHKSFRAKIHGCYHTALAVFPELAAILQRPDWRDTFLAKVNRLGMSYANVKALSSHIASRISSVISISPNSVIASLGRNEGPDQRELKDLKADIDALYIIALQEHPAVAALVERYTCCETFLRLVAERITTRINVQSWKTYIRLTAEGLRYLLDNDVEEALTEYEHESQQRSPGQLHLAPHFYNDGQQPQRLSQIAVQPRFLQKAPSVVTAAIFEQEVDQCFATARRLHGGATLMTANDAHILFTVPR